MQEVDVPEAMPRAGVVSRATIESAIALLQDRHGLTSTDSGFVALQRASQTHNVKLRSVAAAVLTARGGEVHARVPASPRLSFTSRGGERQPNRTQVLRDLLDTATRLSGADYGAIQLRDPVHGGLLIEGHQGFTREFLDHFSYVDDVGTACGTTMARRSQTFVDDVAASPIYTAGDRRVVLGEGVRSVLSTPLRAGDDTAVGAVTTHHSRPRRIPDDHAANTIQSHADECARWLRWYDLVVMPRIVAAAHAAARAAKVGDRGRPARATPAPSPATLSARPRRA